MFRISSFRTMDIHGRTEQLGIKIVFISQLPVFGGILLKHFDLRNESNIFLVDRCINQKRTENCVAHCCLSFSFCFWLIPRSTQKILDLFLIIKCSFLFNKEMDHSISYKSRIISNF